MPLYEYQCDACGTRFERIRKFSDPPLTTCPNCGAEQVQKLVSSPAFQFKGSGWYVTDYAKKSDDSSSSMASAKATAESKADAKADAKGAKTETKPDAAKDSAPAATEKPAATTTPAAAPSAAKDK
jgi:putative FmdB family regulatory protein